MDTDAVFAGNSHLDCGEMTANLVAAYVSHNRVAALEVPALITAMAAAFTGLQTSDQSAVSGSRRVTPAQIRASIRHEALISFEDGKPYKTIKRHLTACGLTPETYRASGACQATTRWWPLPTGPNGPGSPKAWLWVDLGSSANRKRSTAPGRLGWVDRGPSAFLADLHGSGPAAFGHTSSRRITGAQDLTFGCAPIPVTRWPSCASPKQTSIKPAATTSSGGVAPIRSRARPGPRWPPAPAQPRRRGRRPPASKRRPWRNARTAPSSHRR